jgi:hypothetical protein
MEDTRIKLVVIDNHTLGFIFPGSRVASILHASVLRGATNYGLLAAPICHKGKEVRLATEKDFDDFRVVFGQFANEQEYEYQK